MSLLSLGSLGCDSTRNVTGSEKYPSDYRSRRVYVLKRDAPVLERPSRGWISERTLDIPRLEVFSRVPTNYLSDRVIGTMPAGTRLKYERLVYHRSFEYSRVYPIASVLQGQGPFSGKHVDLSGISAECEDYLGLPRLMCVDPEWLGVEGAAAGGYRDTG